MNSSSKNHSSLGTTVVVPEFASPASEPAPGPIRHEVGVSHRMVSPYIRLPAPQGVTGANFTPSPGVGHVITLKQLPSLRQRPSILRRLATGIETGVTGVLTMTTSVTGSPVVSVPTPVFVSTCHSASVVSGGQQPALRPSPVTVPTTDGTYVPRLGSLPKIPGASLRKPDSSSSLNPSDPSSNALPPALTVVLGGIPADLVNRLFSSTNPNTARVFSAPSNNTLPSQFSPKAAAVIAAPLRQFTGSLFVDLHNGGDVMRRQQVNVEGVNMIHPQPVQAVVTLGSGLSGLSELDESSAAVAELASEQHNMVGNESFDDLEDSIQIASAK